MRGEIPMCTKGRPKTDRDDRTVRMPCGLVVMARSIAANRGLSVSELLDEIAGPSIIAEFTRVFGEPPDDRKQSGC